MKRFVFSTAWAVACVQGLALLSGCGGSSTAGGGGGQLQQPYITSFTANPASISSGSSSSLTAVFGNGSGVITPGNLSISSGGSVSVSPTATTAYTLTVTGASGTTPATQSTTVSISGPSIASFTAGAPVILAGSSTTLTATFTGGTGVITAPGGFSQDVTSGTAITINPLSTTSYTLTVSSSTGSDQTETVTVTVDPVPAIGSFTASAPAIEAGSSATLTASFSNGNAVITAPGGFSQTLNTSPAMVTVSPSVTTVYTLTVTPPGLASAAITQTATVTVDPVPTIASFVAGAATIEAGTSTTLTATFAGGTGAISPGNIPVTSGTAVTVSPSATTTYTLTVTPPVGTVPATQTAIVTVDPVPTISSFTANPASVTPGNSTSLTAVFTGGTGIITAPGGYSSPVTSNSPITVTPSATTTYTLTVTPPVGTVNATQTLTVNVGTAAISSFTANPAQIEAGSSSSLIAVFSGGTGEVTAPGGFSSPVTSGHSIPVSPTATTTYTLSVTPTGGGTALTQTTAVTVYPQPAITSFTASAANNTVVAGNSTTLTAVFTGGAGVISAPGITSIPVTSGTGVTVSPATVPGVTYTLTVTPPVGTVLATQALTVTVENGVTVCVSSSCSGPSISKLLLGMNLPSWYDVIDAPSYGTATSIVSAFQTAGVAAVRWPGGSWSDGYHWDGQDTYPTIGSPSGCGGVDPVSDDTFANFLNHIVTPASVDLAITADYGSNPTCSGPGNPSEAAGWAAYAESLGTPIHYMTIGNEEYGDWEYDLHATADQHNPTVYACELDGCTNLPSTLSTGLPSGTPGFYSAIKTAVEGAGGSPSSTLVGAIVDADGKSDGWDATVLGNAEGSYDFVEYHFYPQNSPPAVTSDTPLVQQYAQEFTNNIKTIQKELAAAGASATTPIYVGEIGANSANPGTQSWSITQGLYAGQILGEAMNDGVTRLTWWIGFGNCLGSANVPATSTTAAYNNNNPDLYGWQNTWGSYNVFSDGTTDYPADSCSGNTIPIGTMSPTGEAFNLFQNVLVPGEYPQTATVAGDTTDVRAYAATHGTGYALVLFNLNQTTAQTVSVTIGNSQSSTGVTVMTYDKEIYDQTDPTCQTDAGCSYSPSLTYPAWAGPSTTTMGSAANPVSLPLTLTLQPWSMNVVIVQ